MHTSIVRSKVVAILERLAAVRAFSNNYMTDADVDALLKNANEVLNEIDSV